MIQIYLKNLLVGVKNNPPTNPPSHILEDFYFTFIFISKKIEVWGGWGGWGGYISKMKLRSPRIYNDFGPTNLPNLPKPPKYITKNAQIWHWCLN